MDLKVEAGIENICISVGLVIQYKMGKTCLQEIKFVLFNDTLEK